MNWFKVAKVRSDSGLFFISDPHKTLHANNASQYELGLNYNNFVDFLEMKEKLTGQKGIGQFNDNDGKPLGVCIQGDIDKPLNDVWVRVNEDGKIVEMRVAFDDSIPS